jgi:hypothetical protein
MLPLKMWAFVLAIATGTVWAAIANRPSQNMAADSATAISPLDLPVPADLQSVRTEGGYHFGQVD